MLVGLPTNIYDSRYLDADSQQELPAAKKARIEPNKPLRRKVLEYIGRVFSDITIMLNKENPPYHDLSLGMQVTNIMFTMHTILRQESMGFEGNAARKSSADGQSQISSLGSTATISKASVKEAMKARARETGRRKTPGTGMV